MTQWPIVCDHFAFASAAPATAGGGRRGACRYGIVARSPGVDDRTLRLMDGHLYPAGVDRRTYARSVSLLALGGTIAFTQARNAGHDPDGRPDSIYSHTVLVDRGDFEAIGCDTRVIAAQCPRDEQAGDVQPLEIDALDLGMDFASARRLGSAGLHQFMESMFSKRGVAIMDADDASLLPGLLSLLPAPLRLVPFTSLLPLSTRRHPYKLVQTSAPRQMPGEHSVIDMSGRGPPRAAASSLLGKCTWYLVRMVADRDEEAIGSLYGEMGGLSGLGYGERLCVVAGAAMYDSGMLRSATWAGRIARMLDAAPAGHAAAYIGRLVRFLPEGDRGRYLQRYGARLLASRYAGRMLDAAVFEEMLDECGRGRGVGAADLVEALLDERPDDLRGHGSEILSSSVMHGAAREVVDGFAASPLLRPVLVDALRGARAGDAGRHRKLFIMAAEALSAAHPPYLADIFGADTCDLGSDDGAELLCRAVSLALSGPAGRAGLGPLTGVSEALHRRVLPEVSRASAWRLAHLRDALAGARDALLGALEGARADGSAGDAAAIRRAEAIARDIADTIGGMRAAQRYDSPVIFSTTAWPFWLAPQRRA